MPEFHALDIAPYWGKPDRTIGRPHFGNEDNPFAGMMIAKPSPKPPALPATAKAVAPKVTANPEAVANVIYEQPTPCKVPVSSLVKGDKFTLNGHLVYVVSVVLGSMIHCAGGGLSISSEHVDSVTLVHRAPRKNEAVTVRPEIKSSVFQRLSTEPKCPAPTPNPVPVACPEPPKPTTLEEAAAVMVGGRPANKLNHSAESQVIIFDSKPLSKSEDIETLARSNSAVSAALAVQRFGENMPTEDQAWEMVHRREIDAHMCRHICNYWNMKAHPLAAQSLMEHALRGAQ